MGRDYYSPETVQERQMLALERIADALETLASRDTIVTEAIRERMQPADWWQALDTDGTDRTAGENETFVREVAADAGLTVQRLWKYTATEYRTEAGQP